MSRNFEVVTPKWASETYVKRICIDCGNPFSAPPSDQRIVRCRECQSKHAKELAAQNNERYKRRQKYLQDRERRQLEREKRIQAAIAEIDRKFDEAGKAAENKRVCIDCHNEFEVTPDTDHVRCPSCHIRCLQRSNHVTREPVECPDCGCTFIPFVVNGKSRSIRCPECQEKFTAESRRRTAREYSRMTTRKNRLKRSSDIPVCVDCGNLIIDFKGKGPKPKRCQECKRKLKAVYNRRRKKLESIENKRSRKHLFCEECGNEILEKHSKGPKRTLCDECAKLRHKKQNRKYALGRVKNPDRTKPRRKYSLRKCIVCGNEFKYLVTPGFYMTCPECRKAGHTVRHGDPITVTLTCSICGKEFRHSTRNISHRKTRCPECIRERDRVRARKTMAERYHREYR